MRSFFYYLRCTAILLIVLSISLSAGFYIRYRHERSAQLALFKEFEARMAANPELDHSYAGSTQNFKSFLPGETIAILSVDRLDVKVTVREGIDRDVLRISAGHFPGTALPGEGNFCVAGHSSIVYTCLFNNLREAVVGDEVTVTTQTKTHIYDITEINVVNPEDTYVLNSSTESMLTIVTCTNNGSNRLIITARER